MDATNATNTLDAPATYRITVIFKGDKSKGTPARPWCKHNLTFDQAMEIKDEFMAHRMNQIISLYMIPE